MIGKKIGVRVFNFEQKSNLPRNPFKMCIFNKYGYQLFPKRGGETIESEGWMSCTNVEQTFSAERFYTFDVTDMEAGKDAHTNDFLTHANKCFPTWEFSQIDAN